MSKNDEIKIDDITFDENELLNSIAEENDVDDVDVVDDVECTPDYTKVVVREQIDDALFQKIRNEIDALSFTPRVGMARVKLEEKAVKLSLSVITKYVDFTYKLMYSDEYEDTRDMIVEICLETFQNYVSNRNEQVDSSSKRYQYPSSLSADAIALIILQCRDIRLVKLQSASTNVSEHKEDASSQCDKILCIRVNNKNDVAHGIYVYNNGKDNNQLNRIIANFTSDSKKSIRETIITRVEASAPFIRAYSGNHLVACENGVYDCEKHEFDEYFTDDFEEKYGNVAFMYKIGVKYNKNATDVALPLSNGDTWSWKYQLDTMFDGERNAKTLKKAFMQMLNHYIRSDSEGYYVFLTNTAGTITGGGGKSTALQIMRNLGSSEYILSTQIDELGDEHALDNLANKCAILADESEASDKPLNAKCISVFKKLATRDVVTIRPLYHSPISVRPSCFLAQALNDVPRAQKADNAFYRRIFTIAMEKKFANVGEEMKIIKKEYIYNTQFLEYLLKEILSMGVCNYTKDVLAVCNGEGTEKIKEASEVVYKFMNNLTAAYPGNAFKCFTSIVPVNLLFDMFHNWYKAENNTESFLQMQQFTKQLKEWVSNNKEEWKFVENRDEKTNKLKNIYISKNLADNTSLRIFRDFPAGQNWFQTAYPSNNLTWNPRRETCTSGLIYVGDDAGENRELITALSSVKNMDYQKKLEEDDKERVRKELERITKETANAEDVTA